MVPKISIFILLDEHDWLKPLANLHLDMSKGGSLFGLLNIFCHLKIFITYAYIEILKILNINYFIPLKI
jgi:hypothetical protein